MKFILRRKLPLLLPREGGWGDEFNTLPTMNTNQLKTMASAARTQLMTGIRARLHYVRTTDSAEVREQQRALQELERTLEREGEDALVERVAYTWFNRLVALRFMDVNDYQPGGIRIVSPREGFTRPQLLEEARAGRLPADFPADSQLINDLLDGRRPSANPENEVYRLLLMAACNQLHQTFPFLFESLADYTELLLPEDVISPASILHHIRQGMPAGDCQEVEVLGWLYQFYIAEKKDAVFAKKGKVTAAEIPAATQLFTPRWIVEYMVQNTLGRLWLQSRPQSGLCDHMPYYLENPAGSGETDMLTVSQPEDITLLDPACGSGHILVYAFDLLTKIYEEEGYAPSEIAALILEHNLYGVEIDQRAAQLAAFALLMKARSYHRRALRKLTEPHIVQLQPITGTEEHFSDTLQQAGLTPEEAVLHDLQMMREAHNYGSLIIPASGAEQRAGFRQKVKAAMTQQPLLDGDLQSIDAALEQLDTLGRSYHCVVANPPYMGSGKMNKPLSTFVKNRYPDSKRDLMACFMESGLAMLKPLGFLGMINQQSWMFLSSYEKLREKLLADHRITSLLHLGPRTFPEIGGEVVQSTAFVFEKTGTPREDPYLRLVDFNSSEEKRQKTLEAIQNPDCGWFYTARQRDFGKIPGSPVGYWLGEDFLNIFDDNLPLKDYSISDGQNVTGNNDRFLRFLWEPSKKAITFKYNERHKWCLCHKGGEFKKWFGNIEYLIDWRKEIREYYSLNHTSRVLKEYLWFKKGICWSRIGANNLGFRLLPNISLFEKNGSTVFFIKENSEKINYFLGLLNSNVSKKIFQLINPTIALQVINVRSIPVVLINDEKQIIQVVNELVSVSSFEWNSKETSCEFQKNQLLNYKSQNLEESFKLYSKYWKNKFYQLHQSEEELNRQFIQIYGLEEELTPDVPLEEITILQQELDQKRLKAISADYCSGWELLDGKWLLKEQKLYPELPFDQQEVMAQFVSYAVGCMFGRYSLDKEGLILANQGEEVADYIRKVTGDWWMVDGKAVDGDEKWIIDQNKDVYEHYPELQRTQNLATGYATGESRIPGNEADAEGGVVQPDRSDQAGSGERSEQHRRGPGTGDEGVPPLSKDHSGLPVRTGDPTSADRGAGDDTGNQNNATHGNHHESEKTDLHPDEKTPLTHKLTTNHQPLTTTNQPPITFWPDDDNIIPILDEEWFEDDIVSRFKVFLRASFGDEHFYENLAFLEECLETDIRTWFVKKFYPDHIKRYKKRPIYWLFSSPSGAFQALVYLHRYTPDTLNNLLNNYLRVYMDKLRLRLNELEQVEVDPRASAGEKSRARKQMDTYKSILDELETWEREVIYPLASERIAIDLDDGVLVNYNKFGQAVKVVSGLNDAKAKKKVRGFDWIDTSGIR